MTEGSSERTERDRGDPRLAEDDDNWRKEAVARLFDPRAVAVVGASMRDGYGLRCVRNLVSLGYAGKIYPVNPKYSNIEGMECFPSLAAVPDGVDAVAVAVPAASVEGIIGVAAERGIPNAVVFASGLGEGAHGGVSPASRSLRERANKARVNVVGPNCLGVISYESRAALWVDPVSPEHAGTREGVGLISQSGGLALTMMSVERRLTITHVVSCGNQLDFGVADALEFLVTRSGVRAVGMIIEGLPDVQHFRRAAGRAREAGVCLAVLKIGKSSESARATVAHTGTLSGSRALYEALFRQEDVIEVCDLDELVAVCHLTTASKRPAGRRLVAVADSGGACGLIADAAVEAGLQVEELPAEARDRLQRLLPAYANVGNPLDTTASLWGNRAGFHEVSQVMADAGRGDVLVCAVASAPREDVAISEQWAAMIDGYGDTARSVAVPVVALVAVGAIPGTVHDRIAAAGLVPVGGLGSGLRAIAQVAAFYERARRGPHIGGPPPPVRGSVRRRTAALEVLTDSEQHRTESEAKRLLDLYAIQAPQGAAVYSRKQALELARQVGYPLVAKLEVRGVHHKTDLGGVTTDIRSANELSTAIERLLSIGQELAQEGAVPAVRLERHLEVECELLVAGRRDRDFGAVVSVAAGGVYTEVVADVAERLLPITAADIDEMLDDLRVGPVLRGHRGHAAMNRRDLIGLVGRLATLLHELREVREIELNPVAFDRTANRWFALDALLVTDRR